MREPASVPELPEVETIRRGLLGPLLGRRIVGAGGHRSKKFSAAPEAIGHSISTVGRRGKYLIVGLAPGVPNPRERELVVHLGMTGRLSVISSDTPSRDEHLRAWWRLDDGFRLEFHDPRRFGRLAVVEPGAYGALPTLAALGPEPFDPSFTPTSLKRGVDATRRPIKTALLAQRIVAGLGNIYADEALWRAGIDPRRRTGLGLRRAQALHASIVGVLRSAIDHRGTTLRDYRTAEGQPGGHQFALDVYGRAGHPCRRCGNALRSVELDGRTTTWCVGCQR